MEWGERGEGGVLVSGEGQFHADEHPSELRLPLEEEEEDDDDDEDEINTETCNNEGDEGGEEEDEEEEEEGYRFRFEEDMDPLSFTQVDSSGLQPYQQFERLQHQYEALAAKKRKARADLQSNRDGPSNKKPRGDDDISGANFEEIMEAMNYGARTRRSRKAKKRGRRKGSRNKVSPEVTRKLGDATLHYAHRRYEEAIRLCNEVILLSPNLPDPYHRLGLIFNEMGDKSRSFAFYMLAAQITPKDASLWKLLLSCSLEQGNRGQSMYLINKAIQADPEDKNLWFHRASFCAELGDYRKAAESYKQILRLCPDNIEVLQTAVELYKKCAQHDRAIDVLEDFVGNHPNDVDLRVVDLLASLYIEGNAHLKALEHIEHAEKVYCAGKDTPLYLITKAGICHLHLGNVKKAEDLFSNLHKANINDLVFEVGNSLMDHGHYDSALKYYKMLEGDGNEDNGYLRLKIAKCYLAMGQKLLSIKYFYKAVDKLENSIDARLTLSSLLLEENKSDEAISILSPPKEIESTLRSASGTAKPWWLNGKIKLKLSQVYKAKGMLEDFIDVIFPVVRETLFLETVRQKVKVKKRLTKRVLHERIKVLDEDRTNDTVFHGFRSVASASDRSKGSRALKVLKKRATQKEAKKAAALAAGVEWVSDKDSDDESPQEAQREPPLPDLLKDTEHHRLIVDICKGLSSLQKYWESLEIINLCLKLASNTLDEWKEQLRTLGAQIAYSIADPAHGWDYVRHIVSQRPYSSAAWNCYYKVMSKIESRHSRHSKLLHAMRAKHKDCIPPILITGHQFTVISQHQAAAREYLEAYKLMPDNPLINLCAGTALVNLALGLRLQNKHQCVMQGLAFLYNNLQLCTNKQEALYNIARAYHHVGLVSLAAANYEKILTMHVRDCPIPRLPNENPDPLESRNPGYCDLRREAAYNLHLIYKRSGAFDLARQVLKDHCTV